MRPALTQGATQFSCANERVVGNRCVACDPGRRNQAGMMHRWEILGARPYLQRESARAGQRCVGCPVVNQCRRR